MDTSSYLEVEFGVDCMTTEVDDEEDGQCQFLDAHCVG